MKQKMLYMSHVDWGWIKQRPQFMAEALSAHFDVAAVYTRQNRNRKVLQKRTDNIFPVHPLYIIPLASRTAFTRRIDEAFRASQYRRYMKKYKPDCLYFTFPTQYPVIPKSFTGKIIYDCMDNHTAMANDAQKPVIRAYEEKLVARADCVLVSAQKLKEELLANYPHLDERKITIVRNGYNGQILPARETAKQADTFTISYIGTIGSWFNFEYLLKSLEEFPNLHYRIIGPSDNPNLPQAERLHYMGTVEHHKLHAAIADVQALTMPFQLNDIVEAVDPVKLYEYINFNKNILCIRYKEIERFDPFVYFYTDYESFRNQIQKMMDDNTLRYSQQAREEFLLQSTWASRAAQIKALFG